MTEETNGETGSPEIQRKEYPLKDGTVVWQEPLLLGQMLEITGRLKGEELQGILKGDKIAELLQMVLQPADMVKEIDFGSLLEVEMAIEMVEDFFSLNPRMTTILSGFSSAIPLWLAQSADIGKPSTNGKDSNGSSGSSAEGISQEGSGS